MNEVMTADVVYNLVQMLRLGKPNMTACIVEGGDDKKLFKAMFDLTQCSIVVAAGWENATGALEKLEKKGVPGVLAIIDADLGRFEKRSPASSNLFWSDFHDLEIDLIHSDAFERMVDEVCDMEKKAHPPAHELRAHVLKTAAPLGYLRLHNERSKLSLKMKPLTYSAFVCKETLTVDEVEMVRNVKNKSMRHDLQDQDLVGAIKALADDAHDYRLLCRGHDVTEILSLGLRKVFAKHDPSDVTPERLESILRSAYGWPQFQQTALYAALRRWETDKSPWIILRAA